MDDDLVMAARCGLLLYPCSEPDGVRLDPPFVRFDPTLPRDVRARLLAKALEHRERGDAGAGHRDVRGILD